MAFASPTMVWTWFAPNCAANACHFRWRLPRTPAKRANSPKDCPAFRSQAARRPIRTPTRGGHAQRPYNWLNIYADSAGWLVSQLNNVTFEEGAIQKILYKPFDLRFI